ncbi:MAG: flagellar hook-associated protein FlgL [Deltaproteobacteria bacterium]|nr:flagellar hook-associated protein FlgL [Deltaproteobacteria bacterium]MBI4796881.1 flagellar hook-associated protein FlgL [Deltaproteobacteria bacterium]
MRVSMPTMYGNIQTQLQRLAEELQNTNATISTGRKYQRISDDPVEVGALMGLNVESSQVTQYKSNLDTANSWLSATETALTNINTLVSSTASLAEQMATGTYTAQQRAAAAQQVQQYMEEFMQMGNSRYQGHYILSGYKIDTEPFTMQPFAIQPPEMHLQAGSDGAATSSGTYTGTSSATYIVEIDSGGATGAATYRVSEDGGQTWSATNTTAAGPLAIGTDGAQVSFNVASTNWVAGDRFTISVYQPITYQGDNNTLELTTGRGSRMAVSTVGSEAVGGAGGANDLFQIMAQLKSNLEANDAGEVGARLEELRDYQAHLTSEIAGVGAALNRVEVKQNAYDSLNEQLTTNIANKGDTDLVAAATALATQQLAYQAALQSATKVMGMSLLDYL